ncbi:hypothetical protein PV797_14520 [Clostridiaceae bacterium M8S5]|nr:hypothetical protein PV797_14520 [Clostridiaceae bacterium M8S5]
MKNKILAVTSLLLTIIALSMMLSTRYFPALGDYVLQAIGIEAWTNGKHIAILYFLIPMMIGLIGINKYCYKQLKIKYKEIVILICISIFIFNIALNGYAKWSKQNAEGLLSIEFIGEQSMHDFDTNNKEIVKFDGEVKLKNHSNKKQQFHLGIKTSCNDLYCTSNKYGYVAYNEDNKPLMITLEPNSERNIKVDFKNNVDDITFISNCGSGGKIDEVILFNDDKAVILTYGKFLGSVLK